MVAGELNCACVGITTQLHLTPVVAQQAIKVALQHRASRHASLRQPAAGPAGPTAANLLQHASGSDLLDAKHEL